MQQWIPLSQITLDDPFWIEEQRLIRTVVLPYQWEILNDRVPGAEQSHCVENFRITAGEAQGEHYGMVFQDSDLYKWLEAVAYTLTLERDDKLEAIADEAIALIGRAQQPDGYLDTYYTIKRPTERWRNLTEGHELYCAGHFIEAAVAYHQATGKEAVLTIACKLADCLCEHFMDGLHGYAGHPEIEAALIRLYEETQCERYRDLARVLLDVRGVGEPILARENKAGGFTPVWDHMGAMNSAYLQDHLPVREQTEACGHSVRAMYLYSAMADMALLDGDAPLRKACETLFANTTRKRMYVTGGVGSCADGERFTIDYDLPNDLVYAETCAGIGLMMFARRMWRLTDSAECYDIWERALYNTVLSGMGRDGRHFFYVNPLEVDPARIHDTPALAHVLTQRPMWFGVACCPPNVARCVLSLGGFLFAEDGGVLTVLSSIAAHSADGSVRLAKDGDTYRLTVSPRITTVRLRVPDGFDVACEGGVERDGYLVIQPINGECVYRLTPKVRVLRANPRISADAGKVCVSLGSTVYCLEEADNGKQLCELLLPKNAVFRQTHPDWLPQTMCALETEGLRELDADWTSAYADRDAATSPVTLTFVPYSQWNNRGEGEMTVWIRRA